MSILLTDEELYQFGPGHDTDLQTATEAAKAQLRKVVERLREKAGTEPDLSADAYNDGWYRGLTVLADQIAAEIKGEQAPHGPHRSPKVDYTMGDIVAVVIYAVIVLLFIAAVQAVRRGR